MEYRILPHGGEKISVIGLGSGSITGTEQEMTAVLEAALQNGVNYFDMRPAMAACALCGLCQSVCRPARRNHHPDALRRHL